MKKITSTSSILSLVLLITACGGEDASSKKSSQDNVPKVANEIDEIEHEINEPFLYPFGFDLNNFKAEGYRSSCGGDCCNSTKALSLGEYTIFSDTSGCSEYEYTFLHRLFQGKELIALHEEKSSCQQESGNKCVRYERTIDFENEKTFIRRDTTAYSNELGLTGGFSEEMFDRSEKYSYANGYDDPREYRNFESEEDYSVDVVLDDLEEKKVVFSSSYNPEVLINLVNGYTINDIKGNAIYNLPKDVIFAYSSWWRGDGESIYGILNEGVLQVYYSYEYEEQVEASPFELFLEVDPDVTIEKPDHYIVFDPNKGNNKLLLGFNEKDDALYAKYEGQARHIALTEIADKSQGKKIVKVYQEFIHGIPNGVYTHTHEGIYDYVTYKGKDGKETKYTINRDLSEQDGGGYRDRPLF